MQIDKKRHLAALDEMHDISNKLAKSLPASYEDLEENFIEGLYEAYMAGWLIACEELKISNMNPAYQHIINETDKQIAGKTVWDRLKEAIASGSEYEIKRLFETEWHRMQNTGGYAAAKEASNRNSINKVWITMGDEKVRDTHEYLEGMTVGLDKEFYTFDGDHALFPGGFRNASNNVNCRCDCSYTREA